MSEKPVLISKIYLNVLNDIQSAKITGHATRKQFHKAFPTADSFHLAVFSFILCRTVEYGKFFEKITFEEFIEDSKMSKRKLQMVVNGLREAEIIITAKSTVQGYKDLTGYSLNWEKLTDNEEVLDLYRKERDRIGRVQRLTTNKTVAPHAPTPKSGCMTCTLSNNNNHKDNKNNQVYCASPSASRVKPEEGEMDLKDVMAKAEQKFNSAVEKKAAKAVGKLTGAKVRAVWNAAILRHYPDSPRSAWSENLEFKLAGKLRRDFKDTEQALEFVRWAVENWGVVTVDIQGWFNRGTVPVVPDAGFLLGMYAVFMKLKAGDTVSKDHASDLLDDDPMVRERAKLRAKGVDEDVIQERLKRRRKYILEGDILSAKRWHTRKEYEMLKDYGQGLYSNWARARNTNRRLAAEQGVDPATLVMATNNQVTVGPDGNEYPMEVMIFMKYPEWNDDPDALKAAQDEAFFAAVEEFRRNQDQFEAQLDDNQ